MNNYLSTARRLATLCVSTLLLTACANLADTPAGAHISSIQAQFGTPNYSCVNESGQQRVIWTTQPLGQYAWGANLDENGNTDKVVQLFTNQNFRQLSEGNWDADRVRCAFGPPAEIGQVGLPSVRQTVWSYRYKESGAWNSLMHVYFDRETELVNRFHPGPDPIYESERFVFF